MIAYMITNEEFYPVVFEVFVKGSKLNIFLVFITQSYFPAPRRNKIELQKIDITHLSDTDLDESKSYTENVL